MARHDWASDVIGHRCHRQFLSAGRLLQAKRSAHRSEQVIISKRTIPISPHRQIIREWIMCGVGEKSTANGVYTMIPVAFRPQVRSTATEILPVIVG